MPIARRVRSQLLITVSHALIPGSHALISGSHALIPGSYALIPGPVQERTAAIADTMQARQLSVVLWSLGHIGFCPSDAYMTVITEALAAKLQGTEEQVRCCPCSAARCGQLQRRLRSPKP